MSNERVTPSGARLLRHAESGTCMATEAGPLRMTERHDFGPADLGVSLRDPDTNLIITLYTYPGSGAAVSDAEFEEHFKLVLYEIAKSLRTEKFAVDELRDRRFPKPGLRAMGVGELNGVTVMAVVILLTKDRWLFKLRATFPLENAMKARDPTYEALGKSFNPCS